MANAKPEKFEKDGHVVETALPAEKVRLRSNGFKPVDTKKAAPAAKQPTK